MEELTTAAWRDAVVDAAGAGGVLRRMACGGTTPLSPVCGRAQSAHCIIRNSGWQRQKRRVVPPYSGSAVMSALSMHWVNGIWIEIEVTYDNHRDQQTSPTGTSRAE
ncbi:MAG: hypothetical protein Q9M09_00100 [Mariprofundaceae bacterium]|nr:hypothetical protein [Mariprofundaceae bacterium]